jgi:hypothetical protein
MTIVLWVSGIAIGVLIGNAIGIALTALFEWIEMRE